MYLLLQCLSSRATAKRTEALLPRRWLNMACCLEVENKSFVFPLPLRAVYAFASSNCLYLDPQVLFHLIFSPSVLLRREFVELLGGHLGARQGQPTALLGRCYGNVVISFI